MDENRSRKKLAVDGSGARIAVRTAPCRGGAFSPAACGLDGPGSPATREAPHPPHTRSKATCDAAFATLEKLNRGVLLLDAVGVVQFMNRAARAMISRGHGLSLRKRRLAFVNESSQAVFDACLEGKLGNLVLRVGGPNHAHRPYSALLSPLESQDGAGGFCVFIHEPLGKQRPVPAQVLRQLYGLTAAEARLVNALYVGQSLQSAAGTGGISLNTAKSVLKRVFVKCEVGTQAELLQLLSLGPRTL